MEYNKYNNKLNNMGRGDPAAAGGAAASGTAAAGAAAAAAAAASGAIPANAANPTPVTTFFPFIPAGAAPLLQNVEKSEEENVGFDKRRVLSENFVDAKTPFLGFVLLTNV